MNADRPDYWNHNIHYQRLVLRAVPPACGRALDVGCGDGLLVRRLAPHCGEVVGIDMAARMIRVARQRCRDLPNVSFVQRDFMACPFGENNNDFDFVCSVTAIHHMDFAGAVTAMRRLLRPGGRLVIVGLARDASPADWLAGAAAVLPSRVLRVAHGESSSGAPVAAPQMSWSQVRAAAMELLPGVRYRRHLLWRYSLVWQNCG
ncbi:MAG TPA: class I SAM-dependent methyltransferase [Streptosporangiaceae bacterium]